MKKLIVFLLVLISSCTSNEYLINKYNNGILFSSHWYPIKYDTLWGYADFKGNTIISPQFEEASLFQYGLAIVKQGNYYGYINNTGKWIIKPKYSEAEPFIFRYHGLKNKQGGGQKELIAKVDEGSGSFYINTKGSHLKNAKLSNEIGACLAYHSRLNEYSSRNADGSYELIYDYWRLTSDTSGIKIRDTSQLKLDTIIELNTNLALLKKDSKYALCCTENLKGIDLLTNQRYLIPIDSSYTIEPDFIYDQVKFIPMRGVEQTMAVYQKDGKWGIPSYASEPVIPFIYNDIKAGEYFNTYLVEFEEDSFGYISLVSDSHNKSKRVLVEHFKRGAKK